MMIDRRAFIQSAFLVVTTTAATVLLPLSLPTQSEDSVVTGPMQAMLDDETDYDPIVLKIDGWDRSAVNVTNEVVIKVSNSWRTGWR